MIHALNHLGARFADFALSMLVQSSLLIVLLFALDLVLRNRVRAVVRYALWMLVLIKLALPPSFAAPTSLAYWLPEQKAVKTPPAPSQQFVVRYSDVKFDEARPLPSLPPPRAKLQFAGWLLLAWLATAVGLMAWLVRRSRSVVQTAARAFPASESPEKLLDACRQQVGIKWRVRLKLSATAGSPAVCGLWRPVILIPQQLADKLSAFQLRAVLFHELAHIKRSDALVHHLQTLLQIIYWWHPLLWFANAQIRRVREQAVDEAVVVAMGSDAEAYLATLLEVAKLAFNRPTFALGLIGIVESKSALAQRVQHLLNRPIPKSARLGFTGLTALFLAGAAFLPMARGQRTPNQPQQVASESGQPQPVVAMDVRFIEIEESHLATVGLGEPTLTEFNGHRAWVLTPDQLDGVLQRVQEQTAADILAASRVTTFSGQQSHIQVLDAVPAYGTEIRVGPICDLIPYVSGELVDLAVVASVAEPRPVDPTAPFTSVADAFLTNEVGTARVIVGNGGGVVLENPEAKSSKGNRYLVIVSAAIVSADRAAESQTLNQASTAATGAATRKEEAPKASFQNATRTPPTNFIHQKITYLNASSGAASSNFAARSRAENNVLPTPPAKSTQARPTGTATKGDASVGESGQLTVTIAKAEPYFYFSYLTLATKPVSLEKLQEEFKRAASMNPAVTLSIRAERDVPLGLLVKVADAAKQAGIKSVTLFTVPQTSGSDSLRATNTDGSMERNGAKSAERLLNQPANAGTESQSKPVRDGSVSSSISPRDRMPVLGDLPLFGPGREAIEAKLKQIILPEVIFDNLPLPEALRWLTEQARKHDPDGTGLNFLLNPNVIGAAQQTIIDPTTGQPVILPSPQQLDMNTVMARINPLLKNVRLSDVIEAIVKTADKPIRYSIEEYAVIFSLIPAGTAHLETHIFGLDPKTFAEDAHRFLLDAGWSDIEIFGHSNDWKDSIIRKFLESMGVSRVPPNSIFYSYGTGGLIVRATHDELERVQKAVERLNALRPRESASKSPTPSARVGEGKLSQSSATEEIVVAITAQYTYLGSQPVTLETLKTRLAEAVGRNPKLNLVVKSHDDAPVDQVAGVLETARSLNIEPFTTKLSESTKLETRVFRADPATLLEGLRNTADVPPNSGTTDSIQDSIRGFFTAAGVNVQPPNALFFNDRTGVLMVRATAQELDLAQKAIEVLNVAPQQITIAAKFMELPTEVARQLGLELPPPDRASDTWTRILTAAQTRTVLHAAGQHAGVDILSVPKITTLSGRQAQIQAVQIKTIVNGIKPEALTPPGVRSTNGAPEQPYVTSQIPVGPTLDVTPFVAVDGYTIHLSALPQVTEFLRYDTTLNGANETRAWVGGRQQKVPIPRPIIRQRSMHAAVDVYDGQTLVLANPQVAVVSKEPTGESVTNAVPEDAGKRLLVFITATLIDPAGNPIHTSGHEPWSDKTPSQQP